MIARRFALFAAVLALLCAVFTWGYATAAHKVFPFAVLEQSGLTGSSGEQPANSEYQLGHVPPISGERYSLLETQADVVMLGDSITASGRWDELFPESSIINRGVNGDRVGGVLLRLPSVLQAEPDKVFIMIGINDVAARNTNPQILERYQSVISGILAAGAKAYVQSVIPCRPNPYGPCDPQMQAQIAELNGQLETLARSLGAVYVPVGETLSGPQGVLETYSKDGIHPSAQGFVKWQALIKPMILDTSETEDTPS